MFPGRIILLAPNPARPRPAAPPGAPTRPARDMSGFWFDRSVYIGFRLFVLPKRRPGQCLRFAGEQEGGLFLAGSTRRRHGVPIYAAPPPLAPPCAAPTRTARSVCGFLITQVLFQHIHDPQSNVFTLDAFDTIKLSLCLLKFKSGKLFHLTIFLLFRAILMLGVSDAMLFSL